MSSYQIWPYHVTQAQNLSFSYLKSYCPLNFMKTHQISWFCCIPNESYEEDNLKVGRNSSPPPPPPQCGIVLTVDVLTRNIVPIIIAHMRDNNYHNSSDKIWASEMRIFDPCKHVGAKVYFADENVHFSQLHHEFELRLQKDCFLTS